MDIMPHMSLIFLLEHQQNPIGEWKTDTLESMVHQATSHGKDITPHRNVNHRFLLHTLT